MAVIIYAILLLLLVSGMMFLSYQDLKENE